MQKKNRLYILIIVLAVFVLAAAGYAYHRSKKSVTPNTGPSQEQLKQASDIDVLRKKEAIEGASKTNSSTTDNNSGSQNTNSSDIQVSAKQDSSTQVTVFTKLPGYSSGTCNLKVTNGTKSANQSAEVIYQPEYSSCAGFSVPVADLGTGTWTVDLAVTFNGQVSTKSTTVEVH